MLRTLQLIFIFEQEYFETISRLNFLNIFRRKFIKIELRLEEIRGRCSSYHSPLQYWDPWHHC